MAANPHQRRNRVLKIVIPVVITVLVLFVPYPLQQIPAVSLQVVDDSGNRLPATGGRWYYHSSMAYSGWQELAFDERGKASIPQVSVWRNLFLQIVVELTASLPHSGYTSYHSASADLFFSDGYVLNPQATGASPSTIPGEGPTWDVPDGSITLRKLSTSQEKYLHLDLAHPTGPIASFRIVLSKHPPATAPSTAPSSTGR